MNINPYCNPFIFTLARSRLSVAVLCALGVFSFPAAAREYFDPGFLGDMQSKVDLSAFETPGSVAPGVYLVDIYMNRTLVDSGSVTFREVEGKLRPVLTVGQLKTWGVNTRAVAALNGKPDSEEITDLSVIAPQARSRFDLARLRLDLSVPQIAMSPNYANGNDAALWDEGIPALMSSYNFSGSEGRNNSNYGGTTRTRSIFANFRNGLNVGPWRLRSTQTYTYSDQKFGGSGSYAWRTSTPVQRQWRTSNTYLQRDIQALRSEMTAGEGNTGGDILDGIPFRGIQLKSEDSMLPDSRRGFAPVITGTALSDAVVRIKQNGYTIYQTNVAAGPFRIEDIGASGGSGDLQVEVTEADGSRHVSSVAFSSLPVMQREGEFDYEVNVGKYHGGRVTEGSREPLFGMGTLVYGLPDNITLYGGGLAADNYQSAVLGSGMSLGVLGALSVDATWARSQLRNRRGEDDTWVTGESWRVKYAKNMLSTGTSVDLAAFRYSTRDFYSFSDINMQGYSLNDDQAPWALERQRNTWQATLSQVIPQGWGSVYISGTRTNYWGDTGRTDSLRVGYSTNIKGVSLSLNYDIDRIQRESGDWPENRQLSMSLNVPFSLFSNQSLLQAASANYSLTHDNHGRVNQVAGLSGSMMDGAVNYGVSQSRGNQGQAENDTFTLGYQGGRMAGNLGYSNSSRYRTLNYGLSGALMVHQYGVTLGRSLSEGAILVRAPGAAGVSIGGRGLTDWRGYTVLPGVSAYRKNTVTLDPTTLPDGVDVVETSRNVYPTRGAVVLADFKVKTGSQLMLTLTHAGKPVPFGAIATLVGGENDGGIVGDAGRVYLSGMPPSGQVQVRWGRNADQACLVAYQAQKDSVLTMASAVCR